MALLPFLVVACTADPVTPTGDSGGSATDPFATIERQFDWTNDFDTDAKFHVPEDAVGIVWAFHGNGGGLPSVQQPEWIAVYNTLVRHGVGIVITKSLDRQTGVWSLDDQDELVAIFDAMVGTYQAAPRDIPQGVLGFSGGSQMARMFEDLAARQGWQFRAAAIHQGSAQMTAVPTMYIGAENDDIGRTGAYYESSGLIDVCRAAVGDCQMREGREIPLDARRFARIPDVDEMRSRILFDEMVSFGLVDPQGSRTFDFEGKRSIADEMERYNKLSQYGSTASLAAGQLRVVWATHRLSSEFAADEAEFFVQHFTD